MKIPKSVRDLYRVLEPQYVELGGKVDRLLLVHKEHRWHYVSRVKSEESFAMKLETGRVVNAASPDDLFACTLVVENPQRICVAESLVRSIFDVQTRRPANPERTHLAPHSFEFDDLRMYVKWRDEPRMRPSGLGGLLFEVQVKTFLQHAWTIATHDSMYKSEAVNWASSRIAFQVKAMLENAELAIGAANELGASFALARSDDRSVAIREAIAAIESRWTTEQLPRDRRTLAANILNLGESLEIRIDAVWAALDEATEAGDGALSLNLSPFATTLAALIRKRGAELFKPLLRARSGSVFVAHEIELPALAPKILAKIVRPPP